MKQVFRKAGDIASTVIVDDNIVGTWRHKKTKKSVTVTISPFYKLEKEDIIQIRLAAEDLSQLIGVSHLKFEVD